MIRKLTAGLTAALFLALTMGCLSLTVGCGGEDKAKDIKAENVPQGQAQPLSPSAKKGQGNIPPKSE